MKSNIKYDFNEIDYAIKSLYLELKIKGLVEENSEKLIYEEYEKIKDLDVLTIIEYAKQLIDIYINIHIEKALKDYDNKKKSHNKNDSKELNILVNNNEVYEELIQNLEADIRNHIKIQNELKLQNEELISKISQYEDALYDMNEMQKKLEKYELQEMKRKYGDNEKKENEIFILKAENKILKTTIAQYELQIQEIQKSLYINNIESENKIEPYLKSISIENYQIEPKSFENNNNWDGNLYNEQKDNSNKVITRSNTKKSLDMNKNNISLKYGYNNNGIYKINYNNTIDYNQTYQKSNSHKTHVYKENIKEINKHDQLIKSNKNSKKQEIYQYFINNFNTIRVDRSNHKNSSKNVKKAAFNLEKKNSDLYINRSETKEKLGFPNTKFIEAGENNFNINNENSSSYKINFNEKSPIENSTITNNTKIIKKQDLLTPSAKIDNKKNLIKNESFTNNSNKKNNNSINTLKKRISSPKDLSNINKNKKKLSGK